ncbi:hypothetical protein [Micromonospora chokoriensis]|uniref:Uncharacterized protein n=1 Tax=Micromonospora chokoriensis TaxID=356851 RepID=A0A1C4WU36_9ACTN|nr:hypothetical protein [Micromonospora chokoriensis]SCE99391.1 hypothetical protein GA0070612_2811 [Micromonospora chokoriensis]
MVSRRVAALLLEMAARRWPVDVRDDLRREWAAEVHVLAENGRRTKMLGFAASLAVSRAGTPVVDRSALHRRARRTAAALLLSPIACVGIVLGSAYLPFQIPISNGAIRVEKPIWTALTVGMATLLAVFVSRWARHNALDGPLRIALGVVLPIGAAAVPLLYVIYPDDLPRAVPGLLLWLAGLTLALWAAASLAARHRPRAAWGVGVLGALAATDLAVIRAVVDTLPMGSGAGPLSGALRPDDVGWLAAPLWLVAAWTGWSVGVPQHIPWEVFQLIGYQLRVEPLLYLACMPYALAYTIRAARAAPAEQVALAATPV